MSEDGALCPVRALQIYLERTKKLRAGKQLLFVSFKPGFSKDIARSAVSHWIKNTIKLCYEQADNQTLQLSRAKAHDVRALSASYLKFYPHAIGGLMPPSPISA